MNTETEIYQILRKHRLGLKKREELIIDLLSFIEKRDKTIAVNGCSIQLKELDNDNFEDWLIVNGYEHYRYDLYIGNDSVTIFEYQLKEMYLKTLNL